MATFYILYGSETGNAEHIAKDLAALPPPPGFAKMECAAMEKFKAYSEKWLAEPAEGHAKNALVLICSTTGNADPPENASRFVRYIKRKGTVDQRPFRNCAYAVLGLGDTNYDQFCAMGKLIDRKVGELGGTRVLPVACADEATGLEDVVEPWTAKVLQSVAEACVGGGGNGGEEKVESEEVPPATVESAPAAVALPADKFVAPAEAMVPRELPTQSSSPLFIIYGSETGNAEQIAKDLAETYQGMIGNPDVRTFYPEVVCCEMDQFKKKCVPIWEEAPADGTKHGVLVVTSTTGNADPPENASRFTRFLKRKTTAAQQPLRNCAFAVLGLGDTNYDQFCAMGKLMDKKFAEMGGTRARPLACADEATGLEDVVDPWLDKVLYDITDASRGASVVPSATTKVATKAPEEEKKMDVGDVPVAAPTTSQEFSVGVKMVRALLSLGPSTPVATVDQSTIPPKGSCRCSCEFVSAPTVAATKSALDEDGMYSLSHPFESSVVGARYLTATSTDAAHKICGDGVCKSLCDAECVAKCNDMLDEQFPLSPALSKDALERNGKRVIEMKISLPKDGSLSFQPGDSIGVVAKNHPAASTFVLDMLKENHLTQADQFVRVDGEHTMSVKDAVESYLDLCSPIKNKRVLCNFAAHATDLNDQCSLHLLSSKTPKGQSLFESLVVGQRLAAIDLLRLFPSCQSISLEGLFGILPRIPPRYYSISSSPLKSSDSISVAFSVVDYLTPSVVGIDGQELGQRRVHGVATRYLEAIGSPFLSSAADTSAIPQLKIFPKPSEEFHLPEDDSTPIVLVGPGTGIAPFMGFLEHRQASGKSGTIDVFFGCRHADHDWLYKSEMEKLVEDGVISKLHAVFSRDGSTDLRYVQDAMVRDSERLVDLIVKQQARVYICGDGNKMARDVQKTLGELVGGQEYVDQMKQDRRLLLDIWSS